MSMECKLVILSVLPLLLQLVSGSSGFEQVLHVTAKGQGHNPFTSTRIPLASEFSFYDQDKDGFVTLEELAKATRTLLDDAEAPLNGADKDGDGKLSIRELHDAPWIFGADSNSNNQFHRVQRQLRIPATSPATSPTTSSMTSINPLDGHVTTAPAGGHKGGKGHKKNKGHRNGKDKHKKKHKKGRKGKHRQHNATTIAPPVTTVPGV